MAATAQNLKRLVRFLAAMPPPTDNHRNPIRVEIFATTRTVPPCRIAKALSLSTLTFSTATK
jgi:hypothetical protein